MSNDPNIIRVSFEEIQEFHKLNLFDVLPTVDGSVLILTYDPATRLFSISTINLGSSVINLTQNATLATNVTTQTDGLPVERGFIFEKDSSLTEVLQLLTNPIFNAEAILEVTNTLTGVPYKETLLVEIATSTQLSFAYEYNKRQGGNLVAASDLYYLDNVAIANPSSVTYNSLTTGELKIKVVSEVNASFPASDIYDTVDLKVVYPIIYGTSAVDVKPSDFTTGTVLLADLATDPSIELPIKGEAASIYYWFGIQASSIPINWIGVYSNGTLQYSNEGLVSNNFNNKGTVIHKGHTYNVYMTKNKTLFEQNIKLNF
jgi:hypothetical protein